MRNTDSIDESACFDVREMCDIIKGNTLDCLDKESYGRLEYLAMWIGNHPAVLNVKTPQ